MEDIKFVINFDYPACSEDYVHRIGRTARSTNTGTAYTFFTPNNVKQVHDLISVLTEAKQVVSPKLMQLADSARGGGGRGEYISNLSCSLFCDPLVKDSVGAFLMCGHGFGKCWYVY